MAFRATKWGRRWGSRGDGGELGDTPGLAYKGEKEVRESGNMKSISGVISRECTGADRPTRLTHRCDYPAAMLRSRTAVAIGS